MQLISSWKLPAFLPAEIESRNRDQTKKIAVKMFHHVWRCTRKPGITRAKMNKQWKLWQTGSFQTVSRNGIQFSTWSLWVFVWCCSIPFQMGFWMTSDRWHAGLHVYIYYQPATPSPLLNGLICTVAMADSQYTQYYLQSLLGGAQRIFIVRGLWHEKKTIQIMILLKNTCIFSKQGT